MRCFITGTWRDEAPNAGSASRLGGWSSAWAAGPAQRSLISSRATSGLCAKLSTLATMSAPHHLSSSLKSIRSITPHPVHHGHQLGSGVCP